MTIANKEDLLERQYWCSLNVGSLAPDEVQGYVERIKNEFNLRDSKANEGVEVKQFWIPSRTLETNITIIDFYKGGPLCIPTRKACENEVVDLPTLEEARKELFELWNKHNSI